MLRAFLEIIVAVVLVVVGIVALARPQFFRAMVLSQQKRVPFTEFVRGSTYLATVRLLGGVSILMSYVWARDAFNLLFSAKSMSR